MHMLSYCSRSLLAPTQTEKEVRSISQVSVANNSLLEVTGVLIYEGDHFVQVLEGKREVIQKLLDKIRKDPRHDEVTLLADQAINARHYDGWAMETFFVTDPNIVNVDTLKSLSEVYQRNFEMQTNTYVKFIRQLVGEIDFFNIQNSSA